MKQSLHISIVVAMQLLAQLLTQLLVVRIVGVGSDTDAYIAAQAVPSVLVAIITSALQSVWLPRLAVLSSDIDAWRQEQSIAQGQAGLLGGGLLLLMGISITLWLPLFFPGFHAQQQEKAITYCLFLLMAAAFNSQSALLTIALRARNRFLVAEFIALMGTLTSLGAMYFTLPVYGLVAAVWIALGRAVLVYVLQMGIASWPPLSFRKGLACKETWILMRPLLFGTSIYKTSPLVDRYWASHAPVGSITTLSLAQAAIGALATILDRSVSMPVTPYFARYSKEGDYSALRHTYKKKLVIISVIVFLIGLLLFLLKPIIMIAAVEVLNIKTIVAYDVWLLCVFFLGYLHAAASGSLLVAVFYSLNDTKSPVFIGIIGFIFGLILKFVLFREIGVNGLAIAASIYFMTNIFFFFFLLERKIIKIKG